MGGGGAGRWANHGAHSLWCVPDKKEAGSCNQPLLTGSAIKHAGRHGSDALWQNKNNVEE